MEQDKSGKPYTGLDSFNVIKTSPTAFIGGTTNGRGDESGTGNPLTLFNVVGEVEVGVYGVCTVSLVSAGGATIGAGTTSNANAIIASTTATDIDASDVWVDSTPSVDLISVDELTYHIVTNGEDIIEKTQNSQDITAGNIYYVCLFRPLTDGSSVTAVV